MTQWDHLIVRTNVTVDRCEDKAVVRTALDKACLKALNDLGREGWELISVTVNSEVLPGYIDPMDAYPDWYEGRGKITGVAKRPYLGTPYR